MSVNTNEMVCDAVTDTVIVCVCVRLEDPAWLPVSESVVDEVLECVEVSVGVAVELWLGEGSWV